MSLIHDVFDNVFNNFQNININTDKFRMCNAGPSKISQDTAAVDYDDKIIALGYSGIAFDRIAEPTSHAPLAPAAVEALTDAARPGFSRQSHHASEAKARASFSHWPYEVWRSSRYQATGIHHTTPVRQLLVSFVRRRLTSRMKRFRVLAAVHKLNTLVTPGVGADKGTWECWQTDIRLMDEIDPAMKCLAWRDASVIALRKRCGSCLG